VRSLIKAYRVEATDVADFLERYYRPERYHGRGEEYAAELRQSYEKEYQEQGYCFISRHDSVTGRTVSFFGPPEEPQEPPKDDDIPPIAVPFEFDDFGMDFYKMPMWWSYDLH